MSKRFTRRQFLSGVLAAAAAFSAAAVGGIVLWEERRRRQAHPALAPGEPLVPAPGAGEHQFFNDRQYGMIATLAALIVPTDQDPGAAEAGAADYIDALVARDTSLQRRYTQGLALLDATAQERYGHAFLDLSEAQQQALLHDMEVAYMRRTRPVSSLLTRAWRRLDNLRDDWFGLGGVSDFFPLIRDDALEGFYSNPISWSMLAYDGPPQPRGYPQFGPCRTEEVCNVA
ncbi:MAG TPA: gluconate 2-dehydrogenase subunit 3 family protein [Anaerolineae bacterium]|nr:gluconate 2-dehydrogenase subunit 3 family protein [Anaerolineae bacterium]